MIASAAFPDILIDSEDLHVWQHTFRWRVPLPAQAVVYIKGYTVGIATVSTLLGCLNEATVLVPEYKHSWGILSFSPALPPFSSFSLVMWKSSRRTSWSGCSTCQVLSSVWFCYRPPLLLLLLLLLWPHLCCWTRELELWSRFRLPSPVWVMYMWE